MAVSALNFTFIKTPKTRFSDAQIFLHEFTGKSFSREEAEAVWEQILNHKWNMSEHLRRDVGLKVATVDYVEHFYHPVSRRRKLAFSNGVRKIADFMGQGIRSYFEAKGRYPVI